MSDIVLSAGVRSNLLQLQKTSDLITQTQTKLATGKRVNSALDNPVNFFTAAGLSNRAGDLSGLLDSMSSAFNTIQAANNGITAITKLVQSAQALISQANQTADTNVRATLASQFDALLPQIDQLASDSGFNGINLLGGNDLTIVMNEDGSSTVVVTSFSDAANGDLGINTSANNWADSAAIQAAGTQLSAALTTLRSQAQSLRTATKRARTCWRCRPGSNCRPRPYRWRRKPTRTSSGCSNNTLILMRRGNILRRIGLKNQPRGAARHGPQGRTQSRRALHPRRLPRDQRQSAHTAADRRRHAHLAREGHHDGGAGQYAGQTHLSILPSS